MRVKSVLRSEAKKSWHLSGNASPALILVLLNVLRSVRAAYRRLRTLQAAHTIYLWLSGLRAKQGMLPLLAHEVRPCLVYGEAVLEVDEEQAASYL